MNHRLYRGCRAAIAFGALTLGLLGAAVAQQQGNAGALQITRITPSGTDVAEGRQIVFQFDRQVVPLGRMDREAAELPIEIEPALECRWRWIDTSALACQLGEGESLQPATRYSIVVSPGIAAIDGATLAGAHRHEFVTERPRVQYAGFATWRGPGTPVMRVVFTQPVTAASVRDHVFIAAAEAGDARRQVMVEVDPDTVEADPNIVEADRDGEPPSDADAASVTTTDEAQRIWLVSPAEPLPLDAHARLHVEPGLVPAEGSELGEEDRIVVEFDTFPEFRFVGVTCSTNANTQISITASNSTAARACNPLGGVGLSFSVPVVNSEVRDHVEIRPALAEGREDYDPWANAGDYSQLYQPHRSGQNYTVWLPGRLDAATTYSIAADGEAGPEDEFGRPLAAPIDLSFSTDHRPPDYTLANTTAVLESGVDSEVPLYVTNLEGLTIDYRALTADGRDTDLVRDVDLPDVEDLAFPVPLGVREMLGGRSGALYGRLVTRPSLEKSNWDGRLFAQVTPYQVHVKLGHFNTLVWVTDLSTGEPVRNADVSLYTDRITDLTPSVTPIAEARTDRSGVALLAGSELLDPALDLLGYGCQAQHTDECPKLFVRIDGPKGLALLPLDNRFEADTFRASSYSFWSQPAPAFGHLHAWGTTAQGVYRAGDTMQFKVYVRDQNNETYVAAANGPYTLEIVDPAGRTVHEAENVALSEFGGYSGEYTIPETAAVGWYQFKLTAGFSARVPPGQATSDASEAQSDEAWDPTEIVRFPMRVLVSDFTPASFGVTTGLNGDLFETGDEVVVETRAALHSGGPYVDAEARITARIDARPFTSAHPVASSFEFDTIDENGNLPGSITVSQVVDAVGAQGEIRHAFAIPEEAGSRIVYGRLQVEGAVRDDRGAYVTSSAAADFVAVDRLVGLRSNRWVYEQGQPAEIEFIVVDSPGAPTADTEVHVDVERLETMAARVKGAGNAYLTRYVDEWVNAGACDDRSTREPGVCSFVPDAPGSYRLTATITDTRGRMHRTTLHTWVTGPGQLVWNSGNDDALEIVPEAAEYEIGDTARYLVKNPYPGARALVTVERYGVLEQWVETLEGSTPIIEFEVERDFMPGFYLSVLAMSPRVEAPPPEVGELDLGKPAFKLGYVAVPVDDPYKEIAVTVTTDADTYKPGDTVSAKISAAPRERDRQEPIEAAVVVLDEAVLDLIQGGRTYFDPYEGFYTLDPLDVRNFSLLTRLVGRQKIELKGANPGGDGGATFAMRSLFEYVSYWNPSVRLDAGGNGEFEFELPDNLTGWRVFVIATTPTDRMGLGMQGFKVNLPTEVRPVMPNQVTEGDRFNSAFSVMNRTDEARDIRVRITAEGDLAAPIVHEETVRLEAFARTTIEAQAEASRPMNGGASSRGLIRFTVTAEDDVDGDGLSHELPVRARRTLETVAQFGSIGESPTASAEVDAPAMQETVTEALSLPDAILPNVGDIGVVLAPSVIGSVEGAFRYVRDYAYTSWEQRLTRAVMASQHRELADYLPDELDWPGSDAVPAEVLSRAADYQAPNGGMTYFVPQDAYASPYLSAYTALAFGWLREAGQPIPAAVESRLHEYLDTFLKRDVAPEFYSRGMAATVRAVALAALARSGELTLQDLTRYREHVDSMSLFGKALYLQAATGVDGAQETVREVLDIVLQDSNRAAGTIAFNEVLDVGYERILATPLRSNCAILSALSHAQPSDTAGSIGELPIDLARSVTSARGSRNHWRNTQENVFCVNALVDYARRYETRPPNLAVEAAVGGVTLGSASFSAVRDEAVTLSRPIGAMDPGTETTLTLERRGSGRLYYTARLRYAPTNELARGIDAGVDIAREYSVQRNGEWVLLDDNAAIERGELVRVDIFVSLPAARNFLVVDDPVPGGLEPVNRDLATASLVDAGTAERTSAREFEAAAGSRLERNDWRSFGASRWSFYHRELRHDAVRFYSDYLPPGNYHLSYAAQAIADGEFARMPVRAEEMYDPEVYGTGAPGTLTVGSP